MKDEHPLAIPADILEEAQTKAHELRTLLNPYVHALTPAERHDIPKMGEKTLSFVEKSRELAKLNPNLVPSFLDMGAYEQDFEDAHRLLPLLITLKQVMENVDDTHMLAGSEAYLASLTFYNSVKQAASQDVPGAKAVYEELKKRFPHVKRNKDGEVVAE
jgi:hypothetical protein